MAKQKAITKKMATSAQQNVVLNSVPIVVYKTILTIVQYVVRYLILICTFLCEIRRVYAASTRKFGGGLTIDHMSRDLGNLSKLPKHMSFVINEDVEMDYCDLANLVVWTIAMGIPYITIYERHGLLKAGESRLGKMILEKLGNLFGSEKSSGIEVVLKDSSTKYRNGITYPRRVCVQLLSEEDGQRDIVNAARSIIEDVKGKKLCKGDIDIDKVDGSLKGTENLPDPELILQFGEVHSLMGFPPWQTRLTEIASLPSHKNISYDDYHDVLRRYSRCNQRFGK